MKEVIIRRMKTDEYFLLKEFVIMNCVFYDKRILQTYTCLNGRMHYVKKEKIWMFLVLVHITIII